MIRVLIILLIVGALGLVAIIAVNLYVNSFSTGRVYTDVGAVPTDDRIAIVLGARVPVILTSRADSVRARMASCAVAVLYADARRRKATVAAV